MTKDDSAVTNTPVDASDAAGASKVQSADDPVASIEGKVASTKTTSDASKQNADSAINGNPAEDDSEAETDIEPGKESGPRTAGRKSIKHEGTDETPADRQSKRNGVADLRSAANNDVVDQSEKPSDNSNSSILTSVVSSPSRIDDHSSREGSTGSPHSPSKTSVDSDTLARGNSKRKRDQEDDKGTESTRRIKREPSADTGLKPSKKHRSSSPPLRQRRRTLSTASALQDQGQKGTRRKPAPIRTSRGTDELDDTDDSSTSQRNKHRKSASSSHQHNAAANRKMPPTVNTYKYRDRNGRTLLAKACYTDNVESVRERLEENPGHLDAREYAENTPLQIAALRGDAEIVRFLINAGADVHTQNSIKDTPLIDAVENSNFEVVDLLLNAGVNPSQPNAKGEEPLELIPDDEDDDEITVAGKKIKAALLKSKEKWKSRRPSEPTEQQPSRRSTAAQSPRGSPSFATLSRQSTEATGSRRAPRGASTRNDLLWIQPTPARLRKAAGEGDAEATSHILSMGATADSQAVLAAAKGCHQACLELLLAMGSPEADPDPIPGMKEGWDTPLLAALGQSGENLGIIQTLLGQVGFNPTRRLFQGKTYHDIAKERAGANWQAEHDLLKRAYDTWVRKHGSPKVAKMSAPPKKQKRGDADSPKATRHAPNENRKDPDTKPKRSADGLPHRRNSNERPTSSSSHLLVPSNLKSRESSVAASERDRGESPSRLKKRRISSSSEDDPKAKPKQRKRLLTGRQRREGEERKRRSSLTSVDSASSTLKRNGDLKKTQIRASSSPSREKRAHTDRKNSGATGPIKIKRQPQTDGVSESKAARTDSPAPSLKSAKEEKVAARRANDDKVGGQLVAPTAPMTGLSATDAESDNKKRKQAEEDKKTKAQEQKRLEEESAERERKAEAERKIELEKKEAARKEEAKKQEAARKAEADRKRKEEEEERARKEKEEEEQRERTAKAAQALKQKKLDWERLPEGLWHALHEFSSPPTTDEQRLWCPLRAIASDRLGLHCPNIKQHSDEGTRWLLNFQVAILLGLKDWSLSDPDFQDWPRADLPAYLAAPVAAWWTSCFTPRKSLMEESEQEYWARLASSKAKFTSAVQEAHFPFFWVRVDDFAKVLPKHPKVTEINNQQGELRVQMCTVSAKLKPPPGKETQMKDIPSAK